MRRIVLFGILLLVLQSVLVSAYTPQVSNNVSLVLTPEYTPQMFNNVSLVLLSSHGKEYGFNCSSSASVFEGGKGVFGFNKFFSEEVFGENSINNNMIVIREGNGLFSTNGFVTRGFFKFLNNNFLFKSLVWRVRRVFKLQEENISVFEKVNSYHVFNRGLSDNISVVSIMQVLKSYKRRGVGEVSVEDLLFKMGLFNKNSFSAVDSFDALQEEGVFCKSLNSTININALFNRLLVLEREGAGEVSVEDLLFKMGLFSENVYENARVGSFNNRFLYFTRTFDSKVSAGSSVFRVRSVVEVVNDFFSSNSNLVVVRKVIRSVHEFVGVGSSNDGWLLCEIGNCHVNTVYLMKGGGSKVVVEYTAYPVYYGDVPIAYQLGWGRIVFGKVVRESFDWLFNSKYFFGVVIILLFSVLFSSLAYYKMVRFKKEGGNHV